MAEPLWDFLVAGGGPAGMAAAARAAAWGLTTALVDDNPILGGQIWRGHPHPDWMARLHAAGAAIFTSARLFAAPAPGVLLAETPQGGREFRYRNLLVATGARELFLPFPGWTRPNVLGAGGLQALVKSGLPIAGKRVVVAGSGPLLLAVAAYLRGHGAEVPLIAEQAGPGALARFAVVLARSPAKLTQAWRLRRQARDAEFACASWPLAAEAAAVVLRRAGRVVRLECDYLACGFHLVPNLELPALLGCRLRGGGTDLAVATDDELRSSVAGVYCAGEAAGVGGLEAALAEGQIAAAVVAGHRQDVAVLSRRRARARRFARWLDRTYRLRPELRGLARADTLVCRCEDVAYARLADYDSWRAAKIQTRCGMGACQGRICGAAGRFLFGWEAPGVRPPLFPVDVERLT